MSPGRLRAFLRKLRSAHPTPLPVRVRQRPMYDKNGRATFGCTWRGSSHFGIHIHTVPPETCQLDTLLHEWAHVLTWREKLHHSAKWAAKYAELVRWVAGEAEYALPDGQCEFCSSYPGGKDGMCRRCRRDRRG